MSLYQVQKLIYQLNRDPRTQQRYASERDAVLAEYELTAEERAALEKPDIGLLYVLGVNGQLLMHFAALHKIECLQGQLIKSSSSSVPHLITAHGADHRPTG